LATAEEKRFINLINEHQGLIHKVCIMYENDPDVRNDLFQEIVFQLWKSFSSFRGEAKITTWMYRIALNTAMATYRRRSAPVHYVERLPDYAEPPGDDEESRRERLMLALQQLSDTEKAVIALHFEDLSYEEIAGITGMNANHVGVKLHRIKTKLQKLLKV